MEFNGTQLLTSSVTLLLFFLYFRARGFGVEYHVIRLHRNEATLKQIGNREKRNSIFNYCFRKFLSFFLPSASYVWLWRPLHVLLECKLHLRLRQPPRKEHSAIRNGSLSLISLKEMLINTTRRIQPETRSKPVQGIYILFMKSYFIFQQSHQRPAIASKIV